MTFQNENRKRAEKVTIITIFHLAEERAQMCKLKQKHRIQQDAEEMFCKAVCTNNIFVHI